MQEWTLRLNWIFFRYIVRKLFFLFHKSYFYYSFNILCNMYNVHKFRFTSPVYVISNNCDVYCVAAFCTPTSLGSRRYRPRTPRRTWWKSLTSCSPDLTDYPRWVNRYGCSTHRSSALLNVYIMPPVRRNTSSSGSRFWAIVTIASAVLLKNDPITLCLVYTWDCPWSKPSSKNGCFIYYYWLELWQFNARRARRQLLYYWHIFHFSPA